MTVHRCEAKCGRPAPTTALCAGTHGCGHKLAQWVANIPALIDELETTLSRQTAMGRAEGGQSAEKPLPYNVSASAALDDLRRAWAWVTTLDTDTGLLYRVVKRAVEQAQRVVDRPSDRRYAGACGNDDDRDEPCTQELYAEASEGWIKCPRCDRNWDVENRRQVLLAVVRDRVVNAATLSAALTQLGQPVEAGTIRQWAKRGKIVKVGDDTDGRPLYLVGDVLDVIDTNEREALRAFSNTV